MMDVEMQLAIAALVTVVAALGSIIGFVIGNASRGGA